MEPDLPRPRDNEGAESYFDHTAGVLTMVILLVILLTSGFTMDILNIPIVGDFGHHLQICVGDYIPNN